MLDPACQQESSFGQATDRIDDAHKMTCCDILVYVSTYNCIACAHQLSLFVTPRWQSKIANQHAINPIPSNSFSPNPIEIESSLQIGYHVGNDIGIEIQHGSAGAATAAAAQLPIGAGVNTAIGNVPLPESPSP